MKKLFEEEELKKLELDEEKGVELLENEFKSVHIEYDVADSVLNEGLNINLYTRKYPDTPLSVIPWVRPKSMTIRDLIKNLGNYPRLNIAKKHQKIPNEKRIKYMLDLASEKNLYFLVALPRLVGDTLFWLERYDDIPLNKWQLSYRKSPKKLDRIILTRYKTPDFINVHELKELIEKSIEHENRKK